MRFISAISLLIFSCSLWAQDLKLPPLRGPVQDDADILSDEFVYKYSLVLKRIYKDGGPQIQIVTVPSLQGHTIEEFTILLAEQWKLGRAKENDGVIFLIAPKERKVRIEVGSDLEGDLTDFDANKIIRDNIVPSFKGGDYKGGAESGLMMIFKELNLNQYVDSTKLVSVRKHAQSSKHPNKVKLVFLIIFLVLPLVGSLFKNWFFKGMATGVAATVCSYFFAAGALSIVFIVFAFLIGFLFGATGLVNLFLHTGGGRFGSSRGGFGSGGFGGGGGWSGGGGGFSGGGSSGSW